MSSDQIAVDELPQEEAAGKPGKTLAPGLTRNLSIIGAAILLAICAMGALIYFTKVKVDKSAGHIASTSIPAGQAVAGATATDITPADEARLGRVQTRESEDAQASKTTYIPQELPLKTESFNAPAANSNGAGHGYNYNNGENTASQVDQQRDANIRKGIEIQLASLLARNEAPPVQRAEAYVKSQVAATSPSAAAPASAASSAAAADAKADYLIKGLKVAGAHLSSPLDTNKTEFISAVIDTGPLAGAYLIGKGRMVGEEGVQMTFSRMRFNDEDYAVDVTGLDNQTSSDALGADIDRKLLARYVMPVIFSTAQAYLNAVARPAQEVVVTPNVSASIVTPAAAGREAAAAGLAAGVGKASEAFGGQKASAYLPVNSSIALLFNTGVQKKVQK